VANDVAEACWPRHLLQELHTLLTKSTLIYCDNVSIIYLTTNPIQHQRTKHVDIVDTFTKGLPTSVFLEFQFSLNIRSGYNFDWGALES
jgi:hypothetical protein